MTGDMIAKLGSPSTLRLRSFRRCRVRHCRFNVSTESEILSDLSEVRWKEGGDFTSDGVRVIYTEGKGGQSGVAILLEERIAKCVIRAESYKDRLLMLMIKAYPVDIVVIQVYMPTGASEEEEVDSIYEVIEEKLSNIKGSEYTIVMGDWNQQLERVEKKTILESMAWKKETREGRNWLTSAKDRN